MKKHLKDFTLMGITVRTTNQDGKSRQDIANLYAKFFADNIASLIEGKLSTELICAYTEYETDMNGAYTVLLGYKVPESSNIPEGLESIHVHATDYEIFISPDASPETVLNTWMEIWQSATPRAYRTDFDIYLSDGTVETYISVK